ncbi:MAG: hypothetical protein H6585_10150 [Flavobacteriales bacterium]|nr:hypothetical protein [Flavobacteriales bacterium]
MFKAMVYIGIGFWAGRAYYKNVDRETAEKKEKEVKQKLVRFLNEMVEGFENKKEAEQQVNKIMQ